MVIWWLTRALYGDRGAGLGEAVAEEGSAGGLSSTCWWSVCKLFAFLLTMMVMIRIVVLVVMVMMVTSRPPSSSVPPLRSAGPPRSVSLSLRWENKNPPLNSLFTWYFALVSKTDEVSASTHHTYRCGISEVVVIYVRLVLLKSRSTMWAYSYSEK